MTEYGELKGHVFYRRMAHKRPMISHSEGIYLFDTQGRRYIDASGGPIVVNVGHGVEEIVQTMAEQARQAAYVHATMFTSEPIEAYSAALAEIVPLDNPRFFFLASGSEAVETAVKFARQVQVDRGEPGRYRVIARWHSYHGTTLGALAVSGRPGLRQLFQPMMADMPHIPPPYCYRCPFGAKYPACGLACAHALEEAVKINGRETVAAFIAEPVSGASLAAAVPPNEYWPLVRQICDHYGLLLIADEVMTGFGRTGRWFGMHHWGVQPDVVTMAKGAGGGYFPLSITAVKTADVQTIRTARGDFVHGGTFSHHAVAAATGLAVLKYLQKHNLVDAARRQGEKLGQKLHAALGDHPHVGDIRGRGLMWGLEFVADRDGKTPFPAARGVAKKIGDAAFERGLIVYPSSGNADGVNGDQVMVAPPFIVTDDQLDEIVGLLVEAVSAVIGD
ncbi:MAG: aminotransferase class III-fold pyridoxal phosphate-dependent enzyme [Chloroflexi bacterium]|nr:MAG: aminotransferase class III-fold pyridoxal phosphate-dependent enzyme [Chloroflexota bacterium]